ncbi:MAG: hypothetical protein HUK00_01645 [Bacteroidaceae bacterium]|nr:hypothetical protein [Bacteroidaceae bacterium]
MKKTYISPLLNIATIRLDRRCLSLGSLDHEKGEGTITIGGGTGTGITNPGGVMIREQNGPLDGEDW